MPRTQNQITCATRFFLSRASAIYNGLARQKMHPSPGNQLRGASPAQVSCNGSIDRITRLGLAQCTARLSETDGRALFAPQPGRPLHHSTKHQAKERTFGLVRLPAKDVRNEIMNQGRQCRRGWRVVPVLPMLRRSPTVPRMASQRVAIFAAPQGMPQRLLAAKANLDWRFAPLPPS